MSRTKRRDSKNRRTIRDGKTWSLRSEPREWRNLMKTRKRRMATRQAIANFNKAPSEAEGMTWPLDRKPHIYFW